MPPSTATDTDNHNALTASPTARLREVRAMAAWLAAHDIPVFPCVPAGKIPATKHGFKDATTDPARVSTWWTRTPYNVGIATGPAGLVVIDLDTPKPGKAMPPEWAAMPGVVNGADVLAVLADRAHHPFPNHTRTIATPSGGLHLYFTHPTGPPLGNTSGKLGPFIDTRANGGYVVGPPSRTPDGAYRTVNLAPPTPLPAWLADTLTTTSQPERTAPPPIPHPQPVAPFSRGDRYALAAFSGEVEAVLIAAPGTRNDALNRAAHALGSLVAAGRLDGRQVVEALTLAAEHIGLTSTETARTIDSGLRATASTPRHAIPTGRTT
jgi:hypothetical protein